MKHFRHHSIRILKKILIIQVIVVEIVGASYLLHCLSHLLRRHKQLQQCLCDCNTAVGVLTALSVKMLCRNDGQDVNFLRELK